MEDGIRGIEGVLGMKRVDSRPFSCRFGDSRLDRGDGSLTDASVLLLQNMVIVILGWRLVRSQVDGAQVARKKAGARLGGFAQDSPLLLN